jgi:hypothetical protein
MVTSHYQNTQFSASTGFMSPNRLHQLKQQGGGETFFVPRAQLSNKAKQQLASEVTFEAIRRVERRWARQHAEEAHLRHADGKKLTAAELEQASVDATGRDVAARFAALDAVNNPKKKLKGSGGGDGKKRVLSFLQEHERQVRERNRKDRVVHMMHYTFHEGFTNAVRRSVHVDHFNK